MGHIYSYMTSKAGLAKEVVFHEGGLSKGTRYYCISKFYMSSILPFQLSGPVLTSSFPQVTIAAIWSSTYKLIPSNCHFSYLVQYLQAHSLKLPFQLSGPVLTSSFPQVTIVAIWSSTYKLIPSSYHCSYLVQYLQAHSLKLPLQLSGPVLTSSFPQVTIAAIWSSTYKLIPSNVLHVDTSR